MLKKFLILFLLFSTITACKNAKKNKAETQLETTKVTTEFKITNSLGETLNKDSRNLVEDWPEYKELDEIITNYYTITNDDALLKAKDLSNYAQQLRDSIRIDILDRSDVKIRLNVLYNTSLRLADMESIKTIKPEEIKTEVTNIINAFSAINSKINNILVQQNIEKELIKYENN
jgi:hypothetical protein